MDFSARLFRLLLPSATFLSADGHVHLTFDDGPHPTATPAVLEVLRNTRIRATFFVTGSRVREFPDMAKQIVRDGHSIGNHAFHHRNLVFRSAAYVKMEIEECNRAVREATGVTPSLFRPPYGYYQYRVIRVAQSLGMRVVHWSHDVRDFTGRVDAASLRKVVQRTSKGAILLLHDNEETASRVRTYVPLLIQFLQERGFTFNRLD